MMTALILSYLIVLDSFKASTHELCATYIHSHRLL